MKAKGELVKAAKKLMWERGYEGVSPRDLLDESGAGHGSLYHHFKGKLNLASVSARCPMKCASSRTRPWERAVLLWIAISAISTFLATASKVAGWADSLPNRPSPKLR